MNLQSLELEIPGPRDYLVQCIQFSDEDLRLVQLSDLLKRTKPIGKIAWKKQTCGLSVYKTFYFKYI